MISKYKVEQDKDGLYYIYRKRVYFWSNWYKVPDNGFAWGRSNAFIGGHKYKDNCEKVMREYYNG